MRMSRIHSMQLLNQINQSIHLCVCPTEVGYRQLTVGHTCTVLLITSNCLKLIIHLLTDNKIKSSLQRKQIHEIKIYTKPKLAVGKARRLMTYRR